MKKLTFPTVSALCVLLFASCQQPAPQPAPVTQEPAKPDLAKIRMEIQAIENDWANALNTKNLQALMAMYADDAVSMPNDAAKVKGKAAIQQQQEAEFAKSQPGQVYSFETVEVFSEGKQVLEIGKTTVKDPAGKVVRTGKYMALFEKRDGKYLCIREMYNND